MTPLTDEQKKEIQGEVVPMDEGIPVRFVDGRGCLTVVNLGG